MDNKPFFETFPTLKVTGTLHELFEQTTVTRLGISRGKSHFKIYLESSHLIDKHAIYQMEDEVTKQICESQGLKALICEHYSLSAQYNPKRLMEEYQDSLYQELWHLSPMIGKYFKDAALEYEGEDGIILHVENCEMCREVCPRMTLVLSQIFTERCNMPAKFSLVYDQEKKEHARQILDDYEVESPVTAKEEAAQPAAQGESLPFSEKEGKIPAAAKKKTAGEISKDFSRARRGTGGADKDAYKFTLSRSQNPDVIYGRDFDDNTIPISDIVGEIGEVCVRGRIRSNERRDIRNDKSIVKFVLTDYTDTIICKVFVPTPLADELMGKIAPGAFVKVKGITKEDSFEHEVTMQSLFGIMSIPSFLTKREDHYNRKRVELHMHTKMSDMDGVSECRDLVKRAYDWGMPAVAITDHGNIQAFPDANHLVCDLFDAENKKRKANGEEPLDRQKFFKVIYGVECYLVDDLKKIVTFGTPAEDPAFKECSASPEDYDVKSGRFVVFDIETTGFSSDRDRIIEIGAVRYENGKESARFSEFINPRIPIPYRITNLTSITDEMVMGAEDVTGILPKFIDFCQGCVLVGHNVQFDISFIRKNARDLNLACPFTTIDTMEMARVLLPGHKSYNLDAVGKMLDVQNRHHHRAVDDADATAEIFEKLLALYEKQGIETLGGINHSADENPDVIRRLRPYHCILLAKNETGRVNLYRMISASHLTYFFGKPKIPKSMIAAGREGILVGSACVAGELMQALIDERSQERIAEIVRFYDYLEIQPRDNNRFLLTNERYENFNTEEDLLNLNRKVVALGEQFGKPVVATGDVHFLDPEDQIYRTIIQSSMGMGADKEEPAPLYLRTTDEMMEEFSYLGADKCEEVVITNTQKIADQVEAMSPVRPDKCPPVIENSDQQLRDICYNKAHSMYGEKLPKIVEDRLEKELGSIIKNGYSVMYIIAQKLVWKSNEDGYLVGSRGSVGSSFVATMSGITEVNPLRPHYYCAKCHYSDFDSKEVLSYVGRCGVDMPDRVCPVCGEPLVKAGYDIPFETFLGFKGDKEPDIDLNFSGEYQSKAHAYTKVIFGHEQTFKAGTIATVADKTAYGYVLHYCEENNIQKRSCEIQRLSEGCVGVRRSTGQHPGGIVVLPVGQEINTFTPVQHPANDMTTPIITTHFDYHSIDHNLLKLDILGHDDPTIIRMLQDLTGIDPLSIRLDDPGVMKLFTSTESLGITPEQNGGIKVGTLGVPEFGTKFVMGMLEETKPTTMSELIKISGLSHGTDVWLGNAEDLIKSGKCTLSTCIGCRDDIMIYLINKGLDPAEAFKIMENVRKGKVAKGACKQWPEWKEDMKAHDVPDWYMDSCEKIKYMFPKGHAAAYVMMALRIAWFKVHKPLAYYAAYYSIRAKAFDYEIMAQGQQHLLEVMESYDARKKSDDRSQKLSAAEEDQYEDMKVVREMYARGIEFTPIRLGTAKAKHFSIVDGKLMPAYTAIHGMGDQVAIQLEEACKAGPFVSKDDIRQRSKVSQSILDKMGELGILGDLPDSNQFSLFDIGFTN
jgi:DNA polymerase-3 subunit alpha (Gram-positive type)